MTWGSHCPQCGREDCAWARGPLCDGGFDRQLKKIKRAEYQRGLEDAAYITESIAAAIRALAKEDRK